MAKHKAEFFINYKEFEQQTKKLDAKFTWLGSQAFPVCLGALIEVGMLIKKEAQKTVPIETGNLRNSAYIIWPESISKGIRGGNFPGDGIFPSPAVLRNYPEDHYRSRTDFVERLRGQHVRVGAYRRALMKRRRKPTVEVGFTPWYSAPVHERTDVTHASGTGPFFLIKAVDKYINQIPKYARKWWAIQVRRGARTTGVPS
jgi:hypothetical protein